MHSVNNQQENALRDLQEAISVKGQALFLGPGKIFFPVLCDVHTSPEEEANFPLILATIDNKEGGVTSLSDELSIRDKSENLTCSILGIPEFLESQCLTLEKAFELSNIERKLHSKITHVMLEYISHLADMQSVPLAIVEGIKIRNESNVASFSLSIEQRSKRRYASVTGRFLQLVVNLGSLPLPSFVLNDRLREIGRGLMEEIFESGSAPLGLVHAFFCTILLQEPRASIGEYVVLENLFKLLIAGYTCAVESKRIRVGDAEDASHTAASLQYFCHIAALGEFFVTSIGFGCQTDEDEGTRFRRIQEKLSTAKCAPASYLRAVLQKTKRLSPGESPRIEFVPCPNHEHCGTVENIEVQMNSRSPGSLGYTARKIRKDVLKILRNDVMRNFLIPAGFSRDVLSFPDKLSCQDLGYFFGEGDESKTRPRTWSEAFARYLSTGPVPLIVSSGTSNDRLWFPTKQASAWLRTVDELSVLLYILVHLCGGGPPRVTEMVESKLRNTAGSRRNLFIIKKRLAIIVSYSKNSRQTQKPKRIARFLDDITSEILLLFAVFIKPVQCFFLKNLMLEVLATEEYIFCQSGEKVLDRIICREFSKALSSRGLPLNVSLYRQLRTGVAKAFLAENVNSTNEELLFAQAGHTESTARTRYAGGDFGVDELSLAKLEGFYAISKRWHEVIEIARTLVDRQQLPMASPKKAVNLMVGASMSGDRKFGLQRSEKPTANRLGCDNDNFLKRSASEDQDGSQGKRVKQSSHDETMHAKGEQSMTKSILQCACDIPGLTSSDKVNFKSKAQRAATFECSLQTIVTGYSSTMIVILPTSGGKTLCWAAAALREQRSSDLEKINVPITLLILPLIYLQQDMVRKCQSIGLRCGLWDERFGDDITVVICSIDVVITKEYELCVIALSVEQRVARFVLDEAHLALLWEDLRRFGSLGTRLRPSQASFVPLVCLSATLTNNMVLELQRVLHLDGSCVKLYKEFNSRPNVSYQVRRVRAIRSKEMTDACALILREEMQGMMPIHKAFLQQNSGNQACIYHGSMDHEERRANFNKWVDNTSTRPIAMVMTSAFSCGIDYPHVRMVLHAGGSRTIVELAQESGRAGRDGASSKNIIAFDPDYVRNRTNDSCSAASDKEVRTPFGDVNMVLNQDTCCWHQVIESFLNDWSRGPCEDAKLSCDVCERCMVVEKFQSAHHDKGAQVQVSEVQGSIVVNRKRVGAYPRHTHSKEGTGCKEVRDLGESCQISDNSTKPLMVSTQTRRGVQTYDLRNSWHAEQLSLAKCAVCLFNRNKTKEHGSCMRAKCFRCLENNAAHQSKDCKVTPRGNSKVRRCFFCGIPKNKNLHRNGSYDKRDKCEWEVAKNLTLLIWRDQKRRVELKKRIPLLQSASNMQEVGYLLCGGQKEEEEFFLTKALEYMYTTYLLGAK